MTETHDFSYAKAGDLVTCLMFGNGEIKQIIFSMTEFPLRIYFHDSQTFQDFNKFGKWGKFTKATLYHGHVEFEIKVKEPVYEWQWLMRDTDGFYDVTSFETTKPDSNEHWKILSRIEESKREVK